MHVPHACTACVNGCDTLAEETTQMDALSMQDPETELQSREQLPGECQQEAQPTWSQRQCQEMCRDLGPQGPPG